MAAAPILLGGTPAFAQTLPPVPAVDGPGGLIGKPAAGVKVARVIAMSGTQTVFQFTGSDQVLLWSPKVNATKVAMALDPLMIAWVEANTKSRKIKANDDSGSDGSTTGPRLVSDPAAYKSQWGVEKLRWRPPWRSRAGPASRSR